jgi:hypothetical protein
VPQVWRDDGGASEPLERLSVHGLLELAPDVYAHRADPDVRAADCSGCGDLAGVRVSDEFWRAIASLRLETATGTITVLDGRTLHLVERIEAPRRYWLAVLHAIVDQVQRREQTVQ